jgi:hypothetical protein
VKPQTLLDILTDIREQIVLESKKSEPDLRFVLARITEVESIHKDYLSQNEAMLDWFSFGKHVFGCPTCYDNLVLNRDLVLGGLCDEGRKFLSDRHTEQLAESHTKRFLRDFT